MAKSLQEQMLKMGLVNKQKAHKLQKEKSKKNKQQRNSKTPVQNETKIQAQKATLEKKERDLELNLQQKEQADQKAILAQIQQLISLNHLADEKEGEPYNFTDQKKIKTIYVSEPVRDQIGNGRLAIINFKNQYSIIPAGVAKKIALKDESLIIVLNKKEDVSGSEDDPYAKFQVPDDLQW